MKILRLKGECNHHQVLTFIFIFIPLKLTNPIECFAETVKDIQVFGGLKKSLGLWKLTKIGTFRSQKTSLMISPLVFLGASFLKLRCEKLSRHQRTFKKNLSFQTKVLSAPICRGCIPFGLARGFTGLTGSTELPLHLMLANTGLALRLATLLSTLLWKVTWRTTKCTSEKWSWCLWA